MQMVLEVYKKIHCHQRYTMCGDYPNTKTNLINLKYPAQSFTKNISRHLRCNCLASDSSGLPKVLLYWCNISIKSNFSL